MIPWLMAVCIDEDGDRFDTTLAPHADAIASVLGPVVWDGKTAMLTSRETPPVDITPPRCATIQGRRYAVVLGSVDGPEPPNRDKQRLPDSRAPTGLLLVQDGSFRGCYFAVGTAPCWLGQGARAVVGPPDKVLLHTGSAPLVISGQEHAPETTVVLQNGDVVLVGRRRYQFVAMPSEESVGPNPLTP